MKPNGQLPARSRQIILTAGWIGASVAFLASLTAVFGFYRGSPLPEILLSVLVFVAPELVLLIAFVAILLSARLRAQIWIFFRSCDKIDYFFLGACFAVTTLLIGALLELEYVRAKRLRYEVLGPGLAATLEGQGEFVMAARVARSLRRLPWNDRFSDLLKAAETRLSDLSYLKPYWEQQYLSRHTKQAGIQETETLLFAPVVGNSQLARKRASKLSHDRIRDYEVLLKAVVEGESETAFLGQFVGSRGAFAELVRRGGDSERFLDYDRKRFAQLLEASEGADWLCELFGASSVDDWLHYLALSGSRANQPSSIKSTCEDRIGQVQVSEGESRQSQVRP